MLFEELFQGFLLEDERTEFNGILGKGIDKNGNSLEMGWLKTIVAFSNCEGGKLFVGVEDKTHTIVALDKKTADKQIQMVYQEMRNRMDPVPEIKVTTHLVPSDSEHCILLELDVPRSRLLPVFVKDRGAYFTFIRKFGQTVVASSSDQRALLMQSENVSYDSTFTPVQFSMESFSSFATMYEKNKGQKLDERTLVLKGLVSPDGMFSRGALLMVDDTNSSLTAASVVRYAGFDKGGDRIPFVRKLSGPIQELIVKITDLVSDLTENGIVKTPEGERPLFSYPRRSVLEAVANAFAHRNYWMDGAQIQVDLFTDRLEVTSPGSLMNRGEVKKQKNLQSIIPVHRNKVISEALALLGLVQGLGTGFNKIADDYASADDLHKPFVDSDDSFFRITLPNLEYSYGVLPKEALAPRVYTPSLVLNERESLVLGYCYYNQRSVKEIATYLGISVSTYFSNEVLGKLVEKGFLIQTTSSPRKYMSNHALVKIIE